MPNAKRTEVAGWHGGALRIRLAAPPVDGRANEVLCHWLAQQLNCPKRAVRLLRGASARAKEMEIDLPETAVRAWIDAQPALREGGCS